MVREGLSAATVIHQYVRAVWLHASSTARASPQLRHRTYRSRLADIVARFPASAADSSRRSVLGARVTAL
jgi:hypothetical protein